MSISNEKLKSGQNVRIETTFLAIPAAIAEDRELSGSAKVLFGCIFSLSMTAKGCYATNKGLAKRCGISTKQLKRLIVDLEARGLIRRRLSGEGNVRSLIEMTWAVRPRRSMDYQEYLDSPAWRERAEAEKDRAGQRCRVCNAGRDAVSLDTHHRTYERIGHEVEGDLIVLCRDCHRIFHEHGKLAR